MQPKPVLRLLILTIALTAVAGCNLTITPPTGEPNTVELNPNGVIFTIDQTSANLDMFYPQPEGVWTPIAADVAKLEADLLTFLQTAEDPWLRPDPPIRERVPNYMRQYLGIVEEGEQIIYANFFCNSHEIDWHNDYVFVLDGGDCYFQVKYNPATGEFFDLSVNGEA